MQLRSLVPKMGYAHNVISRVGLDVSNHRVRSDFRSGANRTGYVGDERRAFRVGCAAVVAEAAVDAWRSAIMRRTKSRDRRRRDRNTKLDAPVDQLAGRRVQLVFALRVSFSPTAPRVMRRSRDL